MPGTNVRCFGVVVKRPEKARPPFRTVGWVAEERRGSRHSCGLSSSPLQAEHTNVAGGEDHIVPASVNRANYDKYVKSNPAAVTAYKEYPTRSHFTAAEPGWEEIADFALDWAHNPVAGIIEPR